MSNLVNEQVKEAILDEVESMTISQFQNAVDAAGVSGNTIVDEMVENLVEYPAFDLPESKSQCKMIDAENVKELVDLLHNEAKVI